MSLDIFKVKVKYCIYGMIWGIVGIFFLHSFWLTMSQCNLSEIMDYVVIVAWLLFAHMGVVMGMQYMIKHRYWPIRFRYWLMKCRYWQQPEYCVMFLLGIGLAVFTCETALSSFVQRTLTAVPIEIFKIIFLAFPLIIVCSMIGRMIFRFQTHRAEPETNTKDILALTDREITDFNDDKFFGNQIEKFIKEFNRYPGPCVFGIEGPWGVGKTSFANLCCKKLKEKHHDNIVIYKFNPLNYEDSSDVLKNFYTGLIAKIREGHFEPEVEALLDSYMETVISSVSMQYAFFKIVPKFFKSSKSEEAIIKKLNKALDVCNYDIVVIIDDLDRLDFLTIKKIFFLMRNIFRFKKLKFILCYDVENIIWSAKTHLNVDY